MRQEVKSEFKTDGNGNPTGGQTTGIGITINWQDGPLGQHSDRCAPNCDGGVTLPKGTGCTRIPPNGAFVEGVIQAAIERLEFFEASKFQARENAEAIRCLKSALTWLDLRTRSRIKRSVEGTHKP